MVSRTVITLIATLLVLLACAVVVAVVLALKQPSSDEVADHSHGDHSHDHAHDDKHLGGGKDDLNTVTDGFRPSKYGKYRFAAVSSDAGICAEIGA